jgi:transcriptional antiterminator NusG
VTGFLGANRASRSRSAKTKPRASSTPRKNVRRRAEEAQIKVDYEIGDSVKVLEGPFASFNGVVEELDFDKNRVKVSVSIFGRATPVELDFEQVERQK